MSARTAKGYKGISMEGAIATWYARNTIKSLDEFRADARRIAGWLPDGAGVLEVAPGPGYLATELAKMGRYTVTGLDISAKFVELASDYARKNGASVDFRLGNVAQMPFPDSSFDGIVCRAAFKNFAQPVIALNEMHRVLKPGGTASIIDLRGDVTMKEINRHIDGELELSGFNAFLTRWAFRTMLIRRAYTIDSFEDLVAQSNFRSGDIRPETIGFEALLTRQP